MCVCVCVFFPSILDIKFVGRTSRGHTIGNVICTLLAEIPALSILSLPRLGRNDHQVSTAPLAL